MRHWLSSLLLATICLSAAQVTAEERTRGERLQDYLAIREQRAQNRAIINEDNTQGTIIETFEGRRVLVYAPDTMPVAGSRAMVMAFHGGMGNAAHIRASLDMEGTAQKYGFIMVYADGTQASRLGDKFKAWNGGGGCCGQPFEKNTDDVGYIMRLSQFIAQKYGVDKNKIYGMGHSNGAIMIQRVMCEVGVFSAIIPLSGPLNIDVQTCPGAKGKDILAIHGRNDENVPIGGGYGTKGLAKIDFKPLSYAKETFEKSGAHYELLVVEDADHGLKTIMDRIFKTQGISLGEKAARFFHLTEKL
jgi:polyhydroxybutyrate depolymerase